MSKKKLGFGLMRLPLLDPKDDSSIDMEQMKQMVDSFLEQGFTYFDTAWMYCDGKSEEAAKEALVSRHPRDSFTLTTKLPSYMLKKEEDREWLFQEQLRRTGAGYFDYYWLHDVNRESLQNFDRLRCWDFIREKKAQGLVRHIGFSYHDGPELLDKILTEHPEVEYVQLQLNYLDWESLGVQSRKCYEVATRHHKPVIVMEPVKGGALANVSDGVAAVMRERHPELTPAANALTFVGSLPGVMVTLSGMSNMVQLTENVSLFTGFKPFDEQEHNFMLTVADLLKSKGQSPCTACAYCMPCPAGVDIPGNFKIFTSASDALLALDSDRKDFADKRKAFLKLYDGQPAGVRADACVKCNACLSKCPQHISIPQHMDRIRDLVARVR